MMKLMPLHRLLPTLAAALSGAILSAQPVVAAPGGPGPFATPTATRTEGLVGRPFTLRPTATKTPIVVSAPDKPIRVCHELCLTTVLATDKWVPPGLPDYDALVSARAECPEGTRPTGGGVLLVGDIVGVVVFENGPLLDPDTGFPPMRGWEGGAWVNATEHDLSKHGQFSVDVWAICAPAE
jgi:hypothetical protein